MNAITVTLGITSNLGTIPGRIILQKLAYFVKVYCKSATPSYKLYLYGPFSQEIADALQDCEASGILQENNMSIHAAEGFSEACSEVANELEQIKDAIAQVCNAFKGKSPKDMEILATTHFIYSRQKGIYGTVDCDCIIDKVEMAKKNRFKRAEIQIAYETLQEMQLIS